ncbi:type II secretion system protein GspL [Robbsia sp. Bb-Pol-6]|uniref:Type II secretion system protein GspL n=1 Tax=Robbsia betulipollinis TaxID=2981849 RepID=A0ABT3ZSI6_9BURK|nr:type II secretion system protein GspL [Robbsia betulipollinis]MCY0389190.1 type II secretion system protein GspL [Robbsia betulipollinis]
MSTLTVLLPPRDAALSPQAWQLPALRFVLTDRRGRTLRTGEAPLTLLPPARTTVLIVAARDVLLVDAVVPPLAGPRLRQALPNIVEDQLLPDGPPPHIALGPAPAGLRKTAARRTLAAIDRGWLRFLHESFTAAGHRTIRAVPIVACLPLADVAVPLATATAGEDLVAAADGLAVPDAIDAAAALAEEQALADTRALAASATVLIVGMGASPAASGQRLLDAMAAYPAFAPGDVPGLAAAGGQMPGDALYDGGLYQVGASDGAPQVEVAIRRLPLPAAGAPVIGVPAEGSRLAGEGLAVPLDALTGTLEALLPPASGREATPETAWLSSAGGALPGREVFRLTTHAALPEPLVPTPAAARGRVDGARGAAATFEASDGGEADARLDQALRSVGLIARPIDFGALALAARESTFDLCQFEFAAQPWRLRPGVWGQLRLPLGLLAASVVVAVLGLNLQWRQLARERDAIQTRMTELLLEAFPRTSVVLDPAAQMTRSLDALRVAAGELSPDDFLSLTNGLAASLGAIPRTAIDSLDYDRQDLQLTFRPDAKIDGDFRQRLSQNGLDGSFDGKRWTIRSIR